MPRRKGHGVSPTKRATHNKDELQTKKNPTENNEEPRGGNYNRKLEPIQQMATQTHNAAESGGELNHSKYLHKKFKKMAVAAEPIIVNGTHAEVKPDAGTNQQQQGRYVCPYCKLACAKPSVLQKHIRAHTNERPYPCLPCGFAFKTKSNLYKHCRSRAHALKMEEGGAKFSLPSAESSELDDEEDENSSNTPPPPVPAPPEPNNNQDRPRQIYKPKFQALYQEEEREQQTPATSSVPSSVLPPPSPDFLQRHISKIISDNQAIVETVDPHWPRKYLQRQSSREGSASPLSVASSPGFDCNFLPRKLVHRQSSLSESGVGDKLRQTTAQSKLALALLRPHRLESPRSNPADASQPLNLSTHDDMGHRKRSYSEGLSVLRDHNSHSLNSKLARLESCGGAIAFLDGAKVNNHPQNPEGSIIKDLLLKAREAGGAGYGAELTDLQDECSQHTCPLCHIPYRNSENLEIHQLYYCKGEVGCNSPRSLSPASSKYSPGPEDYNKGMRTMGKYSPGLEDCNKGLRAMPGVVKSLSPASKYSAGPEDCSKGLRVLPGVAKSLNPASKYNHGPEDCSKGLRVLPGVAKSLSPANKYNAGPEDCSKGPRGIQPMNMAKVGLRLDVKTSPGREPNLVVPPLPSPGPLLGNTQLVDSEHHHRRRRQDSDMLSQTGITSAGLTAATLRSLEELSKCPMRPALQMFGGEVQILDGAGETKTLRIEPRGSKSPGGLVLGPRESPDTDNVVVTIARSGLHSGGTIVQVPQKPPGLVRPPRSSGGSMNTACSPRLATPSKNFISGGGMIVNPASPVSPHHGYPDTAKLLVPIVPNITTPNLAVPGIPAPNIGHHLPFMPFTSILPDGTLLNPLTNITAYNRLTLPPCSTPLLLHLPQPPKSPVPASAPPPPYSGGVVTILHGGKAIPYVPGMPGPHTLLGTMPPSLTIHKGLSPKPLDLASPAKDSVLCFKVSEPSRTRPSSPFLPKKPAVSLAVPSQQQKLAVDSPRAVLKTAMLPATPTTPIPSIKVDPAAPSTDSFSFNGAEPCVKVPTLLSPPKKKRPDNLTPPPPKEEEPVVKAEEGGRIKNKPKFLRPTSLPLKPGTFIPKKHHGTGLTPTGTVLSLVSPETPRPKKSYGQLYLNGHAYTYLGLKCSTRAFYCTLNRPQPMYVPQSPEHSKLSMYSNWKICLEADPNPFGLDPGQAMAFYDSRHRPLTYTIARPSERQPMVLTHSSYWVGKQSGNKEKEEIGESEADQGKVENQENLAPGAEPPKRVKIFDGGFESNEDYTYVRGRGRGRYVCEECGIRCKKPSMLKKHIRTHTDVRPFTCKHCNFSFKTKGNLTKHMKSKAHYKKCVEMGIVPVPTVVDDSYIDEECLARQQALRASQQRGEGETDSEDNEDDDDEDDEDEEDDDEGAEDGEDPGKGKLEREAACSLLSLSSSTQHLTSAGLVPLSSLGSRPNTYPYSQPSRPPGFSLLGGASTPQTPTLTAVSAHMEREKVSRNTGLAPELPRSSAPPLVLDDNRYYFPSCRTPTLPHPRSPQEDWSDVDSESYDGEDLSTGGSDSEPSEGPGDRQPMDLSGRRAAVLTPTTPISDILTPVCEPATLIASLCSSMDRFPVSSPRPVPQDPVQATMLQAYLTERALQDSRMKQHQYYQHYAQDKPDPATKLKNQPTFTAAHEKPDCLIPKYLPNFSAIQETPDSVIPKYQPNFTASQDKPDSVISTTKFHQTFAIPQDAPDFVVPKYQSNFTALQEKPESIISTTKYQPAFTAPQEKPDTVAPKYQQGFPAAQDKPDSVLSKPEPKAEPLSSQELPEIKPSAEGKEGKKPSESSKLATLSNSNMVRNVVVGGLAFSSHQTSSSPPPTSLASAGNKTSPGKLKAEFLPPSSGPSSSYVSVTEDGRSICVICNKIFSKPSQLRLHVNIHYFERPFRCESCAVSFRTKGHLQKHERSVSHQNKVSMNSTFGTPTTTNPRPFKCDDCKIAFRIHGHLAKHLRSKMHIMKLECVGKLPFGTYAEMEREGISLNEIDTTDCDNSLESLLVLAQKLYEKDPTKLGQWDGDRPEMVPPHPHLSGGETSSDEGEPLIGCPTPPPPSQHNAQDPTKPYGLKCDFKFKEDFNKEDLSKPNLDYKMHDFDGVSSRSHEPLMNSPSKGHSQSEQHRGSPKQSVGDEGFKLRNSSSDRSFVDKHRDKTFGVGHGREDTPTQPVRNDFRENFDTFRKIKENNLANEEHKRKEKITSEEADYEDASDGDTEASNSLRFVCPICRQTFPNLGALQVHSFVEHDSSADMSEDDMATRTGKPPFKLDLQSSSQIKTTNGPTNQVRKRTSPTNVRDSHVKEVRDPPQFLTLMNKRLRVEKDLTGEGYGQGVACVTSAVRNEAWSRAAEDEMRRKECKSVSCSEAPGQYKSTPCLDRSARNVDECSERSDEATGQCAKKSAEPSGGQLKLNCDLCGKVQSSRDSLQQHIMSHAQPRPFVCEFCDAGFISQQQLQSHLVMHQPNSVSS